MPLIQVWLRKGTAPAHRQGISKSIHRAMVDVLGIPEDDYFQVTHELEKEEHLCHQRQPRGTSRRYWQWQGHDRLSG